MVDAADARSNARQLERQATIRLTLRKLDSPNPRLRAEAARRLGQLHAEPLALLHALRDQNSYVRAAAAEALGQAGSGDMDEVVDGLLSAIDDPNDYVCAATIRALGQLQVEAAREDLIPFLDDPEPHICQATILALGRLGPPEIAGEIRPFLDAPYPDVQSAAARALAQLGDAAAGPAILANLQQYLETRDRSAVGPQLKLPKSYIEALTRLQVREAIPTLLAIAQHEIGLRSLAVEALVALQAEEAAPVLAPLLADPSSGLRESLIHMLVDADYRPAIPLIRPLLADPAMPVRQAALGALSRWRDLGAAELVRAMAHHDPNPYVRPHALQVLVDLLGAQALPDLQGLAADPNPRVAEVAQDALERLGSRAVPQPPLPSLIPAGLPLDPATLRAALAAWQAALPAQPGAAALEHLAALDAALTTLLRALAGE